MEYFKAHSKRCSMEIYSYNGHIKTPNYVLTVFLFVLNVSPHFSENVSFAAIYTHSNTYSNYRNRRTIYFYGPSTIFQHSLAFGLIVFYLNVGLLLLLISIIPIITLSMLVYRRVQCYLLHYSPYTTLICFFLPQIAGLCPVLIRRTYRKF